MPRSTIHGGDGGNAYGGLARQPVAQGPGRTHRMNAQSLTAGLIVAAQDRGDAIAVVDGGHRFTWIQHAQRVASLAAGFRTLGLAAGDRVAILADSSHRYIEACFATLWAGGVWAPVNSRFAPPEMREMLEDSAPRILIADAAHAELAAELAAGLPRPPALIRMGGAAGGADYENLLAAHPPAADAGRGGDDLACLFYTGGTTGRAKGVALSHGNLLASIGNVSPLIGFDAAMVHLHCGPLFHLGAGGRLFATTLHGGRHVVLPRFDAAAVLRAIRAEGVTMAVVVPAMVLALLEQPDFVPESLGSLRTLSYGAAPMPQALIEALLRRLPQVGLVQSYGQTELSPVATMLLPGDHVAGSPRLRSAGRAVPNVELRIADAEDRPLPPSAVGEVQVRGAIVMQGYWQRPEETVQALRGGWMHTATPDTSMRTASSIWWTGSRT